MKKVYIGRWMLDYDAGYIFEDINTGLTIYLPTGFEGKRVKITIEEQEYEQGGDLQR